MPVDVLKVRAFLKRRERERAERGAALRREVLRRLGRIWPVLERYLVEEAFLFGSLENGGFRESSDVDIAVRIGKDVDFWGLWRELEEALGWEVDLRELRGGRFEELVRKTGRQLWPRPG